MEVQILAEGVNGHDDAGDAFGQAEARAQNHSTGGWGGLSGLVERLFDNFQVGCQVFERCSTGTSTRMANLHSTSLVLHSWRLRDEKPDLAGARWPKKAS